MMVLITYDVSTESEGGKRRLRRVARQCENFGQRVQNSVFECLLTPAQWADLKHKLEKEIDENHDSLRYYFLGANWERRVEHVGTKEVPCPRFDGQYKETIYWRSERGCRRWTNITRRISSLKR